MVRPQTTARSVGILFSLDTRTVFDRTPAWQELRAMHAHASRSRRSAIRRSGATSSRSRRQRRQRSRGRTASTSISCSSSRHSIAAASARYDLDPSTSLGAVARERGVSPAAAFIELVLETAGELVLQLPVPQPGPRRRRGDARRSARHPRPRRRRRSRRADPRCQPADVLPHLLDPRSPAVDHRGSDPPSHQRHGRSVRHRRSRSHRDPARSPMST